MSDNQDLIDSNVDGKKFQNHDVKEHILSSNVEYADRNQVDLQSQPSQDHSSKIRKDGHHHSHRDSDDRHRDKKKSSKKRWRNEDDNRRGNEDADFDSSDRSHSEDSRRRQHKEKKKKKKHDDRLKERTSKKHQRKEEDKQHIDDESSSTTDSSHIDEDRRRRHNKEKKKKIYDDHLKAKKSKHKKHKKERRHNESTTSEISTSAAPTFGQYGIIKSSDMSKMQRSFEIWLSEVHGVHLSSSNIPRYELQQYFGTYREDYNTATLPHIKYYNFDKWELEEHERQKHEFEQSGQNISAIVNDERNHAIEMQRIAKRKEETALQFVAATMNSTKVQEMQHQKHLHTQMQMAFKMGDHETYRRIKEKLQPLEK